MKKSKYFNELLKETLTEKNRVISSDDLSRRVMDQIQYLPKPLNRNYQPVISKKGWMVIVISTVVIVFASLLSKDSSAEDTFYFRHNPLADLFQSFEIPHFVIPSLHIPEAFQIVIVLFPLLLFIYFLSELLIIHMKNRKAIH